MSTPTPTPTPTPSSNIIPWSKPMQPKDGMPASPEIMEALATIRKAGFDIRERLYWAVWVQEPELGPNDEPSPWHHVQSLDTREDARDEASYQREVHGVKAKIVRQSW